MPNCLALGTWSPSFVSFLEENIHRRKSVGRKSYRVSKNKCPLAQWSRGVYQLQVRLLDTQNMEPIVSFFFERKHPKKKVIRMQKIQGMCVCGEGGGEDSAPPLHCRGRTKNFLVVTFL